MDGPCSILDIDSKGWCREHGHQYMQMYYVLSAGLLMLQARLLTLHLLWKGLPSCLGLCRIYSLTPYPFQ